MLANLYPATDALIGLLISGTFWVISFDFARQITSLSEPDAVFDLFDHGAHDCRRLRRPRSAPGGRRHHLPHLRHLHPRLWPHHLQDSDHLVEGPVYVAADRRAPSRRQANNLIRGD